MNSKLILKGFRKGKAILIGLRDLKVSMIVSISKRSLRRAVLSNWLMRLLISIKIMTRTRIATKLIMIYSNNSRMLKLMMFCNNRRKNNRMVRIILSTSVSSQALIVPPIGKGNRCINSNRHNHKRHWIE